MKKTFSLLVVLLFSTILSAQSIVVESFKHDEKDLDANLEGTIVRDQNGEKCALIKVRSTPHANGFTFNVGQLGVMKVEDKDTETWLYVPYGVRQISIFHPQLGRLDDYDLGMSVKKASTYILSLRVGRMQTIIEEEIARQYLQFKVEPADAFLEVDGRAWTLQDGVAYDMLDYGTYEYRVMAKDYHDEVGKVTLNNAEETKIVSVNLCPAFGWIQVNGSGDLRGAKVYIDNVYAGDIPFKSDKISSGQHVVRVVQKMYKDYIEKVVVFDNQTLTIDPKMAQEFANVTFRTLDGAEIWIDREHSGVTSWTGRIEFGDHEIETKKASHRSQKKVYSISQSTNGATIDLLQPIPIYGSLTIDMKPLGSSVYIDGALKGETPLFLPKILVGNHDVEVRKEGKLSSKQTIIVSEGEISKVQGELAEDPGKYRVENTVGNRAIPNGNNVVDEKFDKVFEQDYAYTPTASGNDLAFDVNGVKFIMKRVDGGTFMMGSNEGSFAEKPAHEVTLDGYYIGETEVTQALWMAVMGSNPSASYARGDNKPVNRVSWDDCQRFINKLNQLTGQKFSLPTEAQWEFAARGGNLSKGYKFAGSNNLSQVAKLDDDVHPVAQKKPNELGLYDMSRNVQEWCNDWYEIVYYKSSPKHNPQGPSSNADSYRVHRGGGCYTEDVGYCCVYGRSRAEATSTNACRGMRLALNSSSKSSGQRSVSQSQISYERTASSNGTMLINEQFNSFSSAWKISSGGEISFQGGKMIFKDTKDYGYSKNLYTLPRDLKDSDFELEFAMKVEFGEELASLFFVLGSEYSKAHALSLCHASNPDQLALKYGTYEKKDKYKGFHLSKWSPFAEHRYKMIKKGRIVEWYVDDELFCSAKIDSDINMTMMGFLVSDFHTIEVDYLTIKLF